jgi:hypothetical protein
LPGGPLISPIHETIDDSPFVIADITYLDLNVVYEIGFAIGRNKPALLVRHKLPEGDRQLVKPVGVFDTLGYHEYETFDDLKDSLVASSTALTSIIDRTELQIVNCP